MRSSTVLFVLCAALVGTHALPTPGYAPSSLVRLNRRAPDTSDKRPPGVVVVTAVVGKKPDKKPGEDSTKKSGEQPSAPILGSYYLDLLRTSAAVNLPAAPPGPDSGPAPQGQLSLADAPPEQDRAEFETFTSAKALPTADQMKAAGLDVQITGDGTKGFGDYVFVGNLGEGGFGGISLVYNVKDKQFYVLKLQGIQFSWPPNEYAIQKKLTDAKVPGVAKVVAEIDKPKSRGMIMEVANGGDLERLIVKSGTSGLKESVARDIFVQLVDGLKAMHDLGVVNRDLKPANVLLFKNGNKLTAKYSDFGLAGVGNAPYPTVYARVTGLYTGWFNSHGDIRYLAPEGFPTGTTTRIIGYKPVDVYALGCTLYEMLSGIERHNPSWICKQTVDAGFMKLSNRCPDAAALIQANVG